MIDSDGNWLVEPVVVDGDFALAVTLQGGYVLEQGYIQTRESWAFAYYDAQTGEIGPLLTLPPRTGCNWTLQGTFDRPEALLLCETEVKRFEIEVPVK